MTFGELLRSRAPLLSDAQIVALERHYETLKRWNAVMIGTHESSPFVSGFPIKHIRNVGLCHQVPR